MEHPIPFILFKKGHNSPSTQILKIITNILNMADIKKNMNLNILEGGEAVLNRQQLQQQQPQYEIQQNIKIISRTKNTKNIAILEK
jgi:hypothetical protein